MTKFLIGILISVVIILLLREVWTWYWKINKMARLLQDQLDEQKRTNQLLEKLIKSKTDDLKPIEQSVED
jgi:hypothetical protein